MTKPAKPAYTAMLLVSRHGSSHSCSSQLRLHCSLVLAVLSLAQSLRPYLALRELRS